MAQWHEDHIEELEDENEKLKKENEKSKKESKKPLGISYMTMQGAGKSIGFITSMLTTFDPDIHSKIDITIHSSAEIERLEKENANLLDMLKETFDRGQILHVRNFLRKLRDE